MQDTKGFKLFGELAVSAMIKDLKQLDHGAMPGKIFKALIKADKLTAEDKNNSLDAVDLNKEKRDGTIKNRACENVSKQRRFWK